jgi:hypothetical protein
MDNPQGPSAGPPPANESRTWFAAVLVLLATAAMAGIGTVWPWRDSLLGIAAAAACAACLGLGWRALALGSRRVLTLAGMLFVVSLTLAAACLFDGLNLQVPGLPLPDRLAGALVGIAASMAAMAVLGWRRPLLPPRALIELMAWPLAVTVAVGVALNSLADPLVQRAADLAPTTKTVLAVPAWASAGGAVAYALLMLAFRRRWAAADVTVGLVFLLLALLADPWIGASHLSDASAGAQVGAMVAAIAVPSALLWTVFGRQSPGYRVIGLLGLSLGVTTLLLAGSSLLDSRSALAYWMMMLAVASALAVPAALFIWRQARRSELPYPEGACATALAAVMAGLAWATGLLLSEVGSDWTYGSGQLVSGVQWDMVGAGTIGAALLVAYYAYRRRTLTFPALLLLCICWGCAALMIEGGVEWVEGGFAGDAGYLNNGPRQALWALPPLAALLLQWRLRRPALPTLRQAASTAARAARRAVASGLAWCLKLGCCAFFVLLSTPQPSLPALPELALRLIALVDDEFATAQAVQTVMRTAYLWPSELPVTRGLDAAALFAKLRNPADRLSRVETPADVMATPEFDRDLSRRREAEAAADTWLVAGRRVGYLSANALDRARALPFAPDRLDARLRPLYEADVSALILDLRATRLESARAAKRLAEGMLDRAAQGKPFLRLEYNSRQAPRTEALSFGAEKDLHSALGLKRLVVLTDAATCGPAELLIRGLRAQLPVHTVGAATCGEPFDLARLPLAGGNTLVYAVARGYAADDPPGPVAPIVPDCPMADDPTALAGSERDPLLHEALHFLQHGRCGAR